MKTIPTLLLLLSGALTITSANAGDCALKNNGSIIEAYSEQASGQMNCEYVSGVESVVTSIQKFSEESVPVNLFVQHQFDNASFDGGTIIEVPEQLIFTNDYGQQYPTDVVANLTTVAHEYGHALLEKKFEQTLLKQFPKQAGFIPANQELSKLKIQAIKNPTEENSKLRQEKNSEILANADYIRFARITTGYSELYADVVAVYEYGEKDAIFKALYYDQMNDFQFKMVQTRDFGTEFDARYSKFMTEEHGYFALTRTYIGKNLWPSNNAQKKVMLKKIGDAIVEEVKALLISGKDLPENAQANKQLIERLKKK
ncbi:MAG: hypothetical protein H7177_11950 [Rhizobacter sp.]|nr:hypothetical protein [Bacteriovorax sp.]